MKHNVNYFLGPLYLIYCGQVILFGFLCKLVVMLDYSAFALLNLGLNIVAIAVSTHYFRRIKNKLKQDHG